MSAITFHTQGNFAKTSRYLKKCKNAPKASLFDVYGQQGVAALAALTPKDSGYTASCWTYSIIDTPTRVGIRFYNTHVNQGHNIAILLQLGHGTGTGGWVEGVDYINPALAPVFEELVHRIEKEVKP